MQTVAYVGIDHHQSFMAAVVLPQGASRPIESVKLMNDPKRIKKYFSRLSQRYTVRSCYESERCGYFFLSLGFACLDFFEARPRWRPEFGLGLAGFFCPPVDIGKRHHGAGFLRVYGNHFRVKAFWTHFLFTDAPPGRINDPRNNEAKPQK